MNGWQQADAHIVVTPVQVHLDTTVLWPALLGDVDRAHDLDAGGHGSEEAARWTVALDEDTIDPIADTDALGEGLDVDVGSAQADRFLNDQVDELDDGSVGAVVEVVAGRRLG